MSRDNLVFKSYQPSGGSFQVLPSQEGPYVTPDIEMREAPVGNNSMHFQGVSQPSNHPMTMYPLTSDQSRRAAILIPTDPTNHDVHRASLALAAPPTNLPPGLGRGRGRNSFAEDKRHRGRGSKASHGVIVPIPNHAREISIAETRLKRARPNGSFEDPEERKDQAPATGTTPAADLTTLKRAKLACDSCAYRKTRVYCLLRNTNS